MKMFKKRQVVKRVDTGEQVTVVDIKPLGLQVFYRIEYGSGDQSLVPDSMLRAVY